MGGELSGRELALAVAGAVEFHCYCDLDGWPLLSDGERFDPSLSWDHIGYIIDRLPSMVSVSCVRVQERPEIPPYRASVHMWNTELGERHFTAPGQTWLEAAARAIAYWGAFIALENARRRVKP